MGMGADRSLAIAKQVQEHAGAWFSKREVCGFLAVSEVYFDRDIRAKLPADAERRDGSGKSARLLFRGRAVVDVYVQRESARMAEQLAAAADDLDDEDDEDDDTWEGLGALGSTKRKMRPMSRLRLAKAQLAEMELAKRLGDVIDRMAVAEAFARVANRLRRAGETLQRLHGREAYMLLEEAIADCEDDVREAVSGGDEQGQEPLSTTRERQPARRPAAKRAAAPASRRKGAKAADHA